MREEDLLRVNLAMLAYLHSKDWIEAGVAHEALECDLTNKDVLSFLPCFIPNSLQNLVSVVSHSALLLGASVFEQHHHFVIQ